MTTRPPEQKPIRSVRIVTTHGITYDFLLSEKSSFKRGWRTLTVKRPAEMRVTAERVSAVPPYRARETVIIDATVLKVAIRTTYVKEVHED